MLNLSEYNKLTITSCKLRFIIITKVYKNLCVFTIEGVLGCLTAAFDIDLNCRLKNPTKGDLRIS